jgi:hypothetical protein
MRKLIGFHVSAVSLEAMACVKETTRRCAEKHSVRPDPAHKLIGFRVFTVISKGCNRESGTAATFIFLPSYSHFSYSSRDTKYPSFSMNMRMRVLFTLVKRIMRFMPLSM